MRFLTSKVPPLGFGLRISGFTFTVSGGSRVGGRNLGFGSRVRVVRVRGGVVFLDGVEVLGPVKPSRRIQLAVHNLFENAKQRVFEDETHETMRLSGHDMVNRCVFEDVTWRNSACYRTVSRSLVASNPPAAYSSPSTTCSRGAPF